ncbi:MAG: D-glycero-beta-D-manno-heptose-7-phosphate kinase [Thermodesulfobacteriota bacterium]|jgi:D-beta-D-heptose 7-phosphate kinase/D-beta-D-heptose 1-phosphate adenosyltransferase|nr:MAG: D-glycero-beta-D-manno-heptose-7-phosphate kinase [Thermodesulfobacteriota bacterium]
MKRLIPKKALLTHIDNFPQARIMVIGDLMIDHFIWGSVNRISPEAPVPVVKVTDESFHLGGAANVVHNIHTLGGKVYVAGVAGDDEMGRKIAHDLRALGISTGGIILSHQRPTTLKTRIIAHNQQVVRFDREENTPLNTSIQKRIISYCKRIFSDIHAVILSDYDKGLLSRELVEEIINLCKKDMKPVIVDPKVEHIDIYKGVTMITPNQKEAGEASGVKILSDKDASRAAFFLQKRIGCESVLITRGEQGMTLVEKNGSFAHIPTLATEVYDVTGAGDTVVSALTLALATGASKRVAALIANYAAGIVIKKVGTASVAKEELKKAIQKQNYILNGGSF